MKTNKQKKWLAAISIASGLVSGSWAQSIERVEPPSWWIGMSEPTVQLMVHGPGVARLQPSLEHAGVQVQAVHRLSSPNYLFVDLQIAPDAQPGLIDLRFEPRADAAEKPPTLHYAFPLRSRSAGSAQRQGFGPKDAIYLLVPDRFAKSGPASSAPGIKEGENRRDKDGRHGGNLAGLRQHLGYIAGLGFTQIWPTPLVENNAPKASYHGYAATDFYRIDPRFGSEADYLALASEARALGLGLIQDIVLNHIGSEHWWMRDLPSPDWLNQWPSYTETQHARATLMDPHAAASDRKRFSEGWFVPTMPDLNQRQPQLANYLIQMSVWWVERAGLSGIRADTYSYSDRDFLARWSARLMQEYPNFNLVGEEWSASPAIVSYWQRGKRNHDGYVSSMPSMMDFPLHGALLAALGETEAWDGGLNKLYEALAHDFLYPDASNLVLFLGNHDTPRIYTLLKEDLALYKMALVYLASTQRIPQFFYGDELLLSSPAQRDDGRVRADFPGGWAGDPVNGFTGTGLSASQAEAQAFVRRLMNWRKSAALVHQGALTHYAPQDGLYTLFRHAAQGEPLNQARLMVVFNKNAKASRLETRRFPEMLTSRSYGIDVLTGLRHELGQPLEIPGRSALLLEVRE
ncbi:alpha-amlyase [Paucibacter sp. KBW04]|uniref:glycoside hydrolase family 13 protein n=1 Tax=Paucibacter sp. KBW04 TaxID=2153361 RepID=UPI000F56C237|nr:glycoside hydrolase family 13 protein [Paucibacter sp. KBW04]RQO62046.1 alpha-amlyase [Paucibacter sp. KBW04]